MKEIKAIIRPGRLPAVRDALRKLPGFPGMSISRVEGFSAPTRLGPRHDIHEELTDYTAKVRLEIVAPDEIVAAIVECITACASTGHIGDGLIWVTPVEQARFVQQ
ncbi:MAG: P-II family nitrogen regulator [Proteobacteria bacterium]|nr:P-II family nitrogen regulator [Pseudomonadota bacterium]HQR03647.1 P-II family nitrogen regulator [Rhodocyclaceae bacterium]